MKNGPYELVVAPDGYPGTLYRGRYAYEHHVVWWRETGSPVPPGFVVHHKDHDKRNNVFSNFELKTPSDHSKEHGKDRPKVVIALSCALCGTSFEREARNVRTKQKSGQTRFYCCRSHQVTHQQKMLALGVGVEPTTFGLTGRC